MPTAIRCHLDEHINPAVAAGLRRRSIDVTTTVGAGLQGASDLEQLSYAVSQERVLVTRDADLLRLHQQRQPHRGITFCRQGRRSVGDLIRGLVLISELLPPEDMVNHVEFI